VGVTEFNRHRTHSPAVDRSEDEHNGPWADPGRTITFSDGVLAIIITLLVLELRPPASETGELLAGLLNQWPSYLAYIASYLYVGVAWTNHKAVFRHIRGMTPALQWLNLAVLFTIGLLPFPTAVVAGAVGAGDRADEQIAVGLYAVIGTLTCLSWLLIFHYLSRHPEVLRHEDDNAFFATERVRAVVGAVL
jgi:uncharacterized membrane protein